MIDIKEFSEKVISYLKNRFHAELIKEMSVIEHCFLFKWARSEKLVIITVHSFPVIYFEKIIPVIVSEINKDETLPNRVELYCCYPFGEDKKDQLKEKMLNVDIELFIHDSPELTGNDYFNSLYNDQNEDHTYIASELLCKYLINGKSAISLKNILLRSNITLVLFESSKLSYDEILSKIQKRLGENIDNIKNVLKKLEKEGKVQKDPINPNLYFLSDHESKSIETDIRGGNIERERFESEFSNLVTQYNIKESSQDDLFNLLVSVYKDHCGIGIDVEENVEQQDRRFLSIYQEYRKRLSVSDIDDDNLHNFLNELRDKCANSSYINRILRNQALQNLYRTHSLEEFLAKRQCYVYLDTPVLIYYLFSRTKFAQGGVEWDDYYYKSSINLFNTRKNKFKGLTFTTTYDYVKEVAGEIRKGLRTAWFFDKNKDLPIPPETSNSFYNYYIFLRDKGGIDKGTTFATFIKDNLNITSLNAEREDFINIVASGIYSLLNFYKLSIDTDKVDIESNTFQDITKQYESLLSSERKDKTRTALDNDVRQTIILSREAKKHAGENYDYYFASWDRSTIPLKKWMCENYSQLFNSYRVDNPATLANMFSIASLDVASTSITYDVFAYADKEYDISSKIKKLYDNVIIPLFGAKGKDDSHAATTLLQLQKDYGEQSYEDDLDKPKEKLSLERVFDEIFSKLKEWNSSTKELSDFLTDTDNTEFIKKTLISSFKHIKSRQSFQSDVDSFGEKLKKYFIDKNAEDTF